MSFKCSSKHILGLAWKRIKKANLINNIAFNCRVESLFQLVCEGTFMKTKHRCVWNWFNFTHLLYAYEKISSYRGTVFSHEVYLIVQRKLNVDWNLTHRSTKYSVQKLQNIKIGPTWWETRRLGISNICKGGGCWILKSELVENWFLYSSNIARKLLVSLWREDSILTCWAMGTNFPTLLLTGFMSLMHFVMYSIIT